MLPTETYFDIANFVNLKECESLCLLSAKMYLVFMRRHSLQALYLLSKMTFFDKLSKLEKTLQKLTYTDKNRIERAFETTIRIVIDQAQIYIEECGVVVHDAEREKLVISGDQCILDCLQVVHNCIQLLIGVKGTGELLEKRLNEAFATATEDAEMLISLCKLPPNYKTVVADSSHMCHVGDCRQKFQNLPALEIHLVTIHELRQAVFGGFI